MVCFLVLFGGREFGWGEGGGGGGFFNCKYGNEQVKNTTSKKWI